VPNSNYIYELFGLILQLDSELFELEDLNIVRKECEIYNKILSTELSQDIQPLSDLKDANTGGEVDRSIEQNCKFFILNNN